MKLQLLVFISTFTYGHHYISLLVITTKSLLKFIFLKKLNIMHSAIIFGNTLQICDFNQPALLSKKEQLLKQKYPVDSQQAVKFLPLEVKWKCAWRCFCTCSGLWPWGICLSRQSFFSVSI